MKKLTADKFEKNQVYRNTIDQISQIPNYSSNGNNTLNSQKPWKNNGCEEFSDQVNQQAINMNNKLLSENQAFRNTLILLNNDLNLFIKQAKEEYIRKKIKEEGEKDENLKEYYKQCLPDIDLIYFKDDCLNLPYERVGALVLDIFKENFKVVKLFLSSISSLLYSHNYYDELGKELDKIRDNLMKIRSNIDVTKILFTERSNSLPLNQTEGFESHSNHKNLVQESKKQYFEVKDFSIVNNQNECTPSNSSMNNRSLSSNKQSGKGALTIINNTNINNNNNNNSNNKQTPNSKYSSSVSRTTSQNKQITPISNEKQKTSLSKQNTIPTNSNNTNNLSNQNGLHFKKDQQQIQQKANNQEQGDDKLFNSAKIEQMIKDKLNSRLKGPNLPSQNSGSEINSNNKNNVNSQNLNFNKQGNLKNNLPSERSQGNDLDSYFQNLKNENYVSNFENDKQNNDDLSLSFVSRVSFHDVTCGVEFDDKMMEGLGVTPRNTMKGNSDPKQMQQELKRWQTILNSSSEAHLNGNPNQINQQQNDINTDILLKNMNQGQQLQTLGGGVDINNRKQSKK